MRKMVAYEPEATASGTAVWVFEPGDPALGAAIAGVLNEKARKAAEFAAAVRALDSSLASRGWILDKDAVRRGPVSFSPEGGCKASIYGASARFDGLLSCGTRAAVLNDGSCLKSMVPELGPGCDKMDVVINVRECADQSDAFVRGLNRTILKKHIAGGAAACPAWYFDTIGRWAQSRHHGMGAGIICPHLPASWKQIADAVVRLGEGVDASFFCAPALALRRWLVEKCGGGSGDANSALTRCCSMSGGAFSLQKPFWIMDPVKGPRSLDEDELAGMDWSGLAAALDSAGWSGAEDCPDYQGMSDSLDPAPLEEPSIHWDIESEL